MRWDADWILISTMDNVFLVKQLLKYLGKKQAAAFNICKAKENPLTGYFALWFVGYQES